MFLVVLDTLLLIGLSSMESAGKKACPPWNWDSQPPLPPATYWLPKADTMKFLGASSPRGLSQHLSSAPKSGPSGDKGSGNFLPQGLGSEMGQGQEVVEYVG